MLPPPALSKELEDDYDKMREMIFGDAPPFKDILATIGDIERRINAGSR